MKRSVEISVQVISHGMTGRFSVAPNTGCFIQVCWDRTPHKTIEVPVGTTVIEAMSIVAVDMKLG